MNGTLAGAQDLIKGVAAGIGDLPQRCDLLVCPPMIHMQVVKDFIRAAGLQVAFGAQDCASTANGAFTGDISAEMLKDAGCAYVIVGHSERRQYHNETDSVIAAKAASAHAQGLTAIICVGEKESERTAGFEKEVVEGQLKASIPASATADNTVIAYEPVWAIGTGKTATTEDVREMHKFIRSQLKEKLADSAKVRILYGGSVKPDNAQSLFSVDNVDGALIGGASLKADKYLAIARAVP